MTPLARLLSRSWRLAHRSPAPSGGGVRTVAPTTPDGQASWPPQVIALPRQAPSLEAWAQVVQQLAPAGYGPPAGDGAP